MIIIPYGTSYVDSPLTNGRVKNLYCPNCKKDTKFIEYHGQKHGKVFFIPIVAIGEEEKYFKCEECEIAFKFNNDSSDLEISNELKGYKVKNNFLFNVSAIIFILLALIFIFYLLHSFT